MGEKNNNNNDIVNNPPKRVLLCGIQRIQSNKLTIQTSVKTKESKNKVTTGLGKTFQTTIRFRLVLDYR